LLAQFDAQEHSFNGLPDSTRLRFSVKSLVRKVCIGLALIATAWALLLHSRAASLGRLREAQHDRYIAHLTCDEGNSNGHHSGFLPPINENSVQAFLPSLMQQALMTFTFPK
jgi:hypothetical protein